MGAYTVYLWKTVGQLAASKKFMRKEEALNAYEEPWLVFDRTYLEPVTSVIEVEGPNLHLSKKCEK